MAAEILSHARLQELLDYEPSTGIFRWKVCRSRATYPGMIAGSRAAARLKNGQTYTSIQIKVCDKLYRAHRLAWFYFHGEWPEVEIDHINGDSTDNRISNLRLVTRKQNSENRKLNKNNVSGYRGVDWYKPTQKWKARLQHNKKQIHVGYFDCPHEAGAAVKAMRDLMFTHANESRHPVRPFVSQ